MKVDVEDINSVKKVLHVEIPQEEVARELDKAYGTLKRNVRIKGFRPGKVPRSILERRFKKEMHAEVSGQLIQNSFSEALKQVELAPVGEPQIDRQDLEEGQSYNYSATIEVCPPIEDLNLKGFELKEKVHTITDQEIEARLKTLQKGSAQLKTVDEDRPVENGDMVIIDYEGFKDGKPFEPVRKAENFLVELGSGKILKDFDEQIVGMRLNTTKEFSVRFPEDYYNKDLAEQEVTFKVTLKEIKEEILPEIDDEFAKDLGEYQTLEELRDGLRKDVERAYDARSKRQLREDIVDKLIDQFEFEVPEGLVKEELSAMFKDAQDAMAQRGMSLDASSRAEEELFEKYRPVAEKKVRGYLLLQKVIEQEGITLSDEVLDQAYEELSVAMNQPIDSIKQFHNSYKDAYEVFRQKTLEKQAIQQIKENSDIERVEAERVTSQDGESESEETETTSKPG